MQTRVYSICRRCMAVFPEGRHCPACDGDAVAAQEIAAATTCAVEAARMARTHPHRSGALFVTGVLAVSLIAGLGMLALAFV
jgi:RNA polymerase subunit RPABC4/transcription elongation factor Spt4